MAEQFKDGLEHLPLRERIAARAKAVAEMAAELTSASPGHSGGMDTLRDKLNETGELAKLLFEQQFIRHGGRKPADPEWSDLDESERDEWWDRALDAKPLIEAARRSSMFAAVSGYQLAEKDMDLLLWLHAEAVWQMDRGASELSRWRSGQRRKSWPVVESVPDGIHHAAELARAQGTEGGDEHDRLLREAAVRLRDLNDAARVLIADRDRERSSRQAWAEEAAKLDDELRKLKHLTRPMLVDRDDPWQVCYGIGGDPGECTQRTAHMFGCPNAPGYEPPETPAPTVCACVPDAEAAALVEAGFTRPQCTVHSDGGAA